MPNKPSRDTNLSSVHHTQPTTPLTRCHHVVAMSKSAAKKLVVLRRQWLSGSRIANTPLAWVGRHLNKVPPHTCVDVSPCSPFITVAFRGTSMGHASPHRPRPILVPPSQLGARRHPPPLDITRLSFAAPTTSSQHGHPCEADYKGLVSGRESP